MVISLLFYKGAKHHCLAFWSDSTEDVFSLENHKALPKIVMKGYFSFLIFNTWLCFADPKSKVFAIACRIIESQCM